MTRPLRLFERRGPGASYEQIVVCQDPASGLRALIVLHSLRLGPAFGGIRRVTYESEAAALTDAVALAEAMSLKCALAGLAAGGGKTVVMDHSDFDPAPAYAALGACIEGLGGRYVCGPDIGTGDDELAFVRTATRHVNAAGNDAATATARGVLAGLRAVLRALSGEPSARGKHFVVQGLGAVGMKIVEALLRADARVTAADPIADRQLQAQVLGAEICPPDQALAVACDVFMPCAVGGVIDEATAPGLNCRAICGSANNQMASTAVADAVARRGIIHAPDVLVSAGAVIEGVYTARGGRTVDVLQRAQQRIDAIEDSTAKVLLTAREKGMSPMSVARARGRAVLAGP